MKRREFLKLASIASITGIASLMFPNIKIVQEEVNRAVDYEKRIGRRPVNYPLMDGVGLRVSQEILDGSVVDIAGHIRDRIRNQMLRTEVEVLLKK